VTSQGLDTLAYQAELETQNQALRYAQLAAEGASERFSALFSSVPMALMVVDETGQILEYNTRALVAFRPQERDAPLTFLQPLVTNAFGESVGQALIAAKSAGQSAIQEIVLNSGEAATLTGDLHIARIANPQHAQAHFICAFVDQGPLLTQREALRQTADELKRRNAEIQQVEAQLRESQKMQAIGTMAGGIAHDFNNILGTILGNVELARQDADINSPAQVSLLEIEKAGRRARDLVRQILLFSRKELPHRECVDLGPVVREVARMVRLTLPQTIDLQVHIDPTTHAVMAETTQVQQALLNLCSNAVDAMGPAGGRLVLVLSRVQPANNYATLQASVTERRSAPRAAQVALAVSDTGAGMDDALVQRVFEPFFTTKPTGQGTGLGLAVVHGVMRAHEGFAHVRSTPGVGSTFTLHFPAAPQMPATPAATIATVMSPAPTDSRTATAPESQPIAQMQSNGQHVMVVDDDQALLFLVERALKRRDYRVSSFTDAKLALETLRAQPQSFDLVVTDHNMPDVSGIELLHEARSIRADLPVALASGYVTHEIEQSALAAGAKALIHKPNDVGQLVDTVQRLLQESTTPR
jgi:two-component system, cell cycle sensor histidine kinase and response regulator CckA